MSTRVPELFASCVPVLLTFKVGACGEDRAVVDEDVADVLRRVFIDVRLWATVGAVWATET